MEEDPPNTGGRGTHAVSVKDIQVGSSQVALHTHLCMTACMLHGPCTKTYAEQRCTRACVCKFHLCALLKRLEPSI